VSRDVIAEKLEALRRCVRRVEAKTPATVEALKSDLDAQDIVSLNLQRATQQVVDIALQVLVDRDAPVPNNAADSVRALVPLGVLSPETAERMGKAIGFRNVAVHAYRSLDWDIVFAIATTRLDDFRQFSREVDAQHLRP
jgi:uncharacterized protein YutE (UPF0331/DUF86 family)